MYLKAVPIKSYFKDKHGKVHKYYEQVLLTEDGDYPIAMLHIDTFYKFNDIYEKLRDGESADIYLEMRLDQ